MWDFVDKHDSYRHCDINGSIPTINYTVENYSKIFVPTRQQYQVRFDMTSTSTGKWIDSWGNKIVICVYMIFCYLVSVKQILSIWLSITLSPKKTDFPESDSYATYFSYTPLVVAQHRDKYKYG
jgi:hypothetical protein